MSRPETMPAIFFSLRCFLKQGLLNLELIIWQTLLGCEVPGSIPVPRGLELEMQPLHLAFMCSRDPNSGPHAFIIGSLKSEPLLSPSAGF